jgi:hypothetical protein
MSGKTSYEFGYADYLAANRLHWNLGFFGRRGLRMLLMIWAFYCVLALVFGGRWDVPSIISAVLTTLAFTLVAAAGLIGLNALLLPRRARRIYDQQRSLKGIYETQWDAETVTVSSPSGALRYGWGDFVKWSENADILMLYQSDVMFNAFPKRALTPDALHQFKVALEQHGVPRMRR